MSKTKKVVKVIYEYDDGEILYVKDLEADMFANDIEKVKFAFPCSKYITWYREDTLADLILSSYNFSTKSTRTSRSSSTTSSVFHPYVAPYNDDDEEEVENDTFTIKRFTIIGDIEAAKQKKYNIKCDAYGKYYVESVCKPSDDVDGKFKFEEYILMP